MAENILKQIQKFLDEDKERVSDQRATLFLSYVHDDMKKVKEVHDFLEKKGHKVWWDQDDINGGIDWAMELEQAIQECDFFIPCLTKNVDHSLGTSFLTVSDSSYNSTKEESNRSTFASSHSITTRKPSFCASVMGTLLRASYSRWYLYTSPAAPTHSLS